MAVVVALDASIVAGCSSSSTSGAGSSSTGGGQMPTSCPPASVVNAALGQSGGAPTLTKQPYGISCTYAGSGPISTKIDFQQDTAATFSAGEKAVPTATVVSGLGDAAYMTTGFLAVLHGSYAIRILSPMSSPQQLEALARKLLG